jgi:thiamine monophosphate synthase
LAPLDVRPWLPPTVALGLSTHAGDDPASWSEADYVFHGPLRATRSKPGAVALGFEGLARARAASERPVLALGGVQASDGPELRHLGLHGAAVLSGWQAEEGAVRAYLAGLA